MCLATDSALPLKPDTSSRALRLAARAVRGAARCEVGGEGDNLGLNRVDRYGLGFG